MTVAEPTIRRWTRDEYYRMGEAGFFDGQRVELIDGEIVQMAPQKDLHTIAMGLATTAAYASFPQPVWIREQAPLNLGPISEPEPDVSVIRGTPRDFKGKGHPRSALLVIEVSDTTLLFDQRVKSALYASAGLQEYWIINLIAQRVEIHRTPRPDSLDWKASKYDDIRHATHGESITPLAAPHASISVNDLLP